MFHTFAEELKNMNDTSDILSVLKTLKPSDFRKLHIFDIDSTVNGPLEVFWAPQLVLTECIKVVFIIYKSIST